MKTHAQIIRLAGCGLAALLACAGPGTRLGKKARPATDVTVAAPHVPTAAAARRLALIEKAEAGSAPLSVLVQALEDEHPVVRRTAARLLAGRGPAADSALAAAQASGDVLVRRAALAALCRRGGATALAAADHALADSSAPVRLAAVQYLASVQPRSEDVLALLQHAGGDGDDQVRAIAARATWPFHRDSTSRRDSADTDRDLTVVQTIGLPAGGWRFRLDPQRHGHRQGWYEVGFDDGAWDTIAIERAWQEAGYDYIGVTWYRRTVDLPAAPEHVAVDLAFGGVDESAWVWLNGHYVGEHDVGPTGWNQPFRLDVTGFVRWGQSNQITVRAMNTAHAGGIWRPVAIEVLR